MTNEGCQHFLALSQAADLLMEAQAERGGVGRGEIGHASILGVVPDLLVGVEFRGVGRKLFRDDFRMFRKVCPHFARTVVNVAAIQIMVSGPGM